MWPRRRRTGPVEPVAPAAWRSMLPVALVVDSQPFAAVAADLRLAAHEDCRMLAGLGHLVEAGAPAGLIRTTTPAGDSTTVVENPTEGDPGTEMTVEPGRARRRRGAEPGLGAPLECLPARMSASPHLEGESGHAAGIGRGAGNGIGAEQLVAPLVGVRRIGAAEPPVCPRSAPPAPATGKLPLALTVPAPQVRDGVQPPTAAAAFPAAEKPTMPFGPQPGPSSERVVVEQVVTRTVPGSPVRVETTAPAAPADEEQLVARLIDPLLRRMRAELRIERDRSGPLSGSWR